MTQGLGAFIDPATGAGTSGSVEQSSAQAQANQATANQNGSGGLGGIMSGILGTGPTITGPNAGAYNAQMNYAANAAAGYNSAALGPNAYTQSAPTISNPYQGQSQAQLAADQTNQQGLAGFLQGTMNGTGPGATAAQAQYQQGLNQSVAANMAMANSTRGGPAALAGAQRQAQENNAQTLAGASAQRAGLMAQQQQAAAGQLGSVYGQEAQQNLGQYGIEQNEALAQAQLQSTNQQQQNAMQLGYGALGAQEQAQAYQGLQGYTTANQAAQGLQLQANQASTLLGSMGIGGFGGAASGALSSASSGSGAGGDTGAGEAAGLASIASDRRVKADVHDEGGHDSLVEDFLRKMDPKSYRYRAGLDAGAPPEGQRMLGVMAQDLEKSPMGSQMVRETGSGKAIDVRSATSGALAGLANLDERMRRLEASRKR